MNNEKDKYDIAIEYLTKYPNEMYTAWGNPDAHEAGCLFQYATRKYGPENTPLSIGCLTMIRDSNKLQTMYCEAETQQLTREIKADKRIPDRISKVTVDDLSVFAEWQRRLDRELGLSGESKESEV